MKRTFFVAFALAFFMFPLLVSADSKSDYEYQLGQYRKNYAEFNLLKKDYIDNPTLDNQQKSILSAKQVLLGRDLAKASYTRYLADLINSKQSGYEGLNDTLIKLAAATQFYSKQAQLSQQIITPSELKTFTLNYLKETPVYDLSFLFAQTALKVAQMERFQLDIKAGFEALLPKMPETPPAQLKARLSEIPTLMGVIDDKLLLLTQSIVPEEGVEGTFSEAYFTPRVEKITAIRTLQQNLINQLVDIDLNYVQP